MSIVSEFKAFILRGNVVDMAVGIIIGAAFSGIVSSLVADIFTPLIGAATGGYNFSDLSIQFPGKMVDPATKDLPAEEQKLVPVLLNYGKFLQKVMDFLIVGFCLFGVVKGMNFLKRKEAAAPPAEPTATEKLLTEIRDELKKA